MSNPHISRYSWKNKNPNPHREFVAEAWAEIISEVFADLSKHNPSAFSRLFYEHLSNRNKHLRTAGAFLNRRPLVGRLRRNSAWRKS